MDGTCQALAVVCCTQSRLELVEQPFHSRSKPKEGSHGFNSVYIA